MHALSFQIFLLSKEDFAKCFVSDESGSFFDLADDRANVAVQNMNQEPKAKQASCKGRNATVSKKKTIKNTSEKTKKPKKQCMNLKSGSQWWKLAFKCKSMQAFLKCEYQTHLDKNLKMDSKNYASRVYHKVDDLVGRECAGEAHAAALTWFKDNGAEDVD